MDYKNVHRKRQPVSLLLSRGEEPTTGHRLKPPCINESDTEDEDNNLVVA